MRSQTDRQTDRQTGRQKGKHEFKIRAIFLVCKVKRNNSRTAGLIFIQFNIIKSY